ESGTSVEEASAGEDAPPPKKKVIEESSDDSSSDDSSKVDLTSLKNVPNYHDGGWLMHPKNNVVENAVDFTIKGKSIVKLYSTDAYVGLYTIENLQGKDDDDPAMSAIEERILGKIKLHPFSLEEQKKLCPGDEDEESSSTVNLPADEVEEGKEGHL
ncbi:hypothetical protein CPB97_004231, partial [Podila verticillata]